MIKPLIPPFKHFIMTIGELPTTFIESMSYYEALTWLVNYIEKNIIPAVDNNAEAVKEIQTEIIRLKEYVDNYFKDLDVQEEIDNKLDEMAQDGTLAEIIGDFLLKNFNSVKSYGAKGDGTTDDTDAILTAISELQDGGKLYFPAGEYIVYSDYVSTTTNPSYPIDKIIKIVGKKNITIFGDGISSIIRTPNQGVSSAKVYHPCTITIDQCENVDVFGLNIQSKGESYGDADAGASLPQNQRQAFVMANGGSALFVSGSKHVNVHDCYFQLCGSCAVVYHSDVSDCIVKNCRANSASYGYAGFCIDTFAYNSPEFNHTITYDGCIVDPYQIIRPEDDEPIGQNSVSGKCGILGEGSASNRVTMNIMNCVLKGARSNVSNNYREGEGIIAQAADVNIMNNILENNEGGLYVSDINSSSSPFTVNFANNTVKSKWFGITMRSQGSSNKNVINITNNEFENNSETVPEEANPSIKSNPTISVVGYSYNNINFMNNTSTGSKYLFNSPYHIGEVNVKNNIVSCDKFIYSFGGGNFSIENNKVKTLASSSSESISHLSTVDIDNVVGYLQYQMKDNIFDTAFSSNHLSIVDNRLDLITKFDVGDNKISNGWIANQTVFKTFKGMIPVKCSAKGSPTSDYARITFSFEGGIMPFGLPIIQDINGVFHKCENYVAFNANNGTSQYYIVDASADSGFAVDQTYMAIFHRS